MNDSAKSWSKHRQEPRFPVQRASVQVRHIEGEVQNLSQWGMAIETRVSLPVGERMQFRVRYAGEEISADGEVRWSYLRRTRKNDLGEVVPVYHAGVAFSDLTEWPKPLLLSGLAPGEAAGKSRALINRRLGSDPRLLDIRRPVNGAVLTRSPAIVRGDVSLAFDGFTVTVNGIVAELERGRFQARVPLVAGPNTLTATVLADRQPVCHSHITVTYTRPGATSRPV